MNRTLILGPALAMFAAAACSSDAAPPKAEKSNSVEQKLAGVYPDKFECSSIATPDTLSQILGGPVSVLDNLLPVPPGVPKPCNYRLDKGVLQTDAGAVPQEEAWTFDFDCRDGMKRRVDKLFAQYLQQTADRIAQYNTASDAGIKPNPDAGTSQFTKPGEAMEVTVGAKALDHNGQAILFIDDDAPCYVRVVGPDGPKRLELAKLVAKNLTFANAPMSPRAFP
jgi:hypothetical protein